MPEVNLLKDTEHLDESQPKPERAPSEFALSTPEESQPKGFGGVFRSMFNRRPAAAPTPAKNQTGSMSLGRSRAGERILTEKKKAGSTVIPLPDDESYNVNLLTEELVGKFNPQQKLLQLGLVALAAAAFVGVVYAGLSYYEKSVTNQVTAAQEQLTQVNRQINALQAKQRQISDTTKKIAAIKGLIDRHVRWTKFFDRLEHYTLPSVVYGTVFSGDVQGELAFTATTDSYEHVAAQYLILQQAVANHDFIRSFSITGATNQVSNNVAVVSFHIAMSLEPTLLENVPTPLTATTPPTSNSELPVPSQP